jgi:hypothetical protein
VTPFGGPIAGGGLKSGADGGEYGETELLVQGIEQARFWYDNTWGEGKVPYLADWDPFLSVQRVACQQGEVSVNDAIMVVGRMDHEDLQAYVEGRKPPWVEELDAQPWITSPLRRRELPPLESTARVTVYRVFAPGLGEANLGLRFLLLDVEWPVARLTSDRNR